jgi:hypothetical protein
MPRPKKTKAAGDMTRDVAAQGDKFVDSMIAAQYSFNAIIDNFRLLTIRRALHMTISPEFPSGCVAAAARTLKTHSNVIRVRLRENPEFFGRKKTG